MLTLLATTWLAACAHNDAMPPRPAPGEVSTPGSIGEAMGSTARDPVTEINSAQTIADARGHSFGGLEFLGEATIMSGTRLQDSEVGGLSGLTWLGDDEYAAVSDDRGRRGPGRFYLLRIAMQTDRLERNAVTVLRMVEVRGPRGAPLVPETFDMEGIAAAADGTVFISSEGEARADIDPFVGRFRQDGSHMAWLELPAKLLPGEGRGVRGNLALESLALSPDGSTLFTATENALAQDGPVADAWSGTACRIVRFDVESESVTGEYVFTIEPMSLRGMPPTTFHTRGLVDMVAVDNQTLLVMERTFIAGSGFYAQISKVSLAGASNVMGVDELDQFDDIEPVAKELLLDLGELPIAIDNLEGMALGPTLADGRRSLLLIADNNFNDVAQITQILAFALSVDLLGPAALP